MKTRHDELAALLKNHNSPYEMPDLSHLPDDERYAIVNQKEAIRDLANRCSECRRIMLAWGIVI
jgi:hypothetical protein